MIELKNSGGTPGPGNLVPAADPEKLPSAPVSGPPPGTPPLGWRQLRVLAALAAILALCFISPLRDWLRFSRNSEFYSYMPLMPLVTAYLIWLRHAGLSANVRRSWGAAAAAASAAAAILALYFLALQNGWNPAEQDELCLYMLAFLLLLLAAGFATLGAATISAIAFPLALLLFIVPYPASVNQSLETFFQYTSAAAAHGMLNLAGTACRREDLVLHLPADFSVVVGPQCSGIHSSQVLLITSLMAGNLFLRSPWRRVFLALFVIPLAILRNGFRIFVISELCVHVNHNMIDSWIHHHGGPVFFVLSLIPFFFVLVWLRKSELKSQNDVKTGDHP